MVAELLTFNADRACILVDVVIISEFMLVLAELIVALSAEGKDGMSGTELTKSLISCNAVCVAESAES